MSSENRYPLCHSLGLKAEYHAGKAHNWIMASDLEAILQKSTLVYGIDIPMAHWSTNHQVNDTHTALLIGIKPNKEKTLAEKISETIEKYFESNLSAGTPALLEIKKLIEEENEK